MSSVLDPNLESAQASHEVPPSQRTLLQVEDNAANADLVEQLIGMRSDLRLMTATNGFEGIQMAIAHQPDLILMDLNMPDISGLEALLILRKDPATAHIPVIALSSNAYPRQIEAGLKAGFFQYLTKPYKINVLLDTIDVALCCFAAENHPTK